MPHRRDDLEPWRDAPLVQALTAPGTPEELGGEHDAMQMFRRFGTRHLRMLRRLGTGGTALTIALVASGGVAAAAYSQSLPSPLQSAASSVFGWAGVQPPTLHIQRVAAHRSTHLIAGDARTGTVQPPAGSPPPPAPLSSLSSPSPTAPRRHVRPASSPRPSPSATAATASASGSPSASASSPPADSSSPAPTPSDSSTATSPPPAPQPATMTAVVDETRIPYNGNVQLTGQLLDADGNPVPHHRASLWERKPGAGWKLLAYLESDDNGEVQASVGPITTDIGLALRCAHLHSDGFRIVMLPLLSASVVSDSSSGTDTLSISAQGAQAGDPVTVLRRVDGSWQAVGHVTLDGDGYASYTRPQPKHDVVLRLVLPADEEHGAATTKVVLPAARH